jgi:hypothetical protein
MFQILRTLFTGAHVAPSMSKAHGAFSSVSLYETQATPDIGAHVAPLHEQSCRSLPISLTSGATGLRPMPISCKLVAGSPL